MIDSCPRCHGRLVRNRDYHSEYISCLACGYVREIAPPVRPIDPSVFGDMRKGKRKPVA